PTINNAVGGVANITPLTPSGAPSATINYGFDGSGGLKFNFVGQGQTKNRRFGIAVTAGSYALAGPIGGWPQFNFTCSRFGYGVINGNEIVAPDYSQFSYGYNPYLPHIYGGFYKISVGAIGCCVTKYTQDTTLNQQRTVSLLYNIAPAVQV